MLTLVVRAQHGNEEAFANLAVAVGGRLHAVAHSVMGMKVAHYLLRHYFAPVG